jgi:beta-glucanase (GH16 family)
MINGSYLDLRKSGCTDKTFYGCFRHSNGIDIINPIQSAFISTKNSATIKFGKVEVRAKLPTGDWIWPAIWMLPKHNVYGGWPASGEVKYLYLLNTSYMKFSI